MRSAFSQPVAAIAVLAGLAGCATPPPPLAMSLRDDAAKVRFVNKADQAWIDLYPQDECNHGINVIHDNLIGQAIRAAADGAPKRAGMLDTVDPADRNIAEFSFEPGQIINVGVGGAPGLACLGGISFRALPASQYEITLTAQSSRCALTVTTLETQSAAVVRRPVRDVRPMVCKRLRP